MKLHRVTSCTRNLTWETELPAPAEESLCEALAASGARIERPLPRLRYAIWPDYRIVLVGKRAQIRLSYLIPDEERRFAAEAAFVQLVDAVAAAK